MSTSDLMTVLVCGVSGVGKTHLISRVVAWLPAAIALRASEIIGEARKNTDPEYLRTLPTNEIESSQELLVRGFERRRRELAGKLVFVDAHSVIDQGASDHNPALYEIAVEVISRLKPAGIVHVEDAVEHIAVRRLRDTMRVRPVRSLEQIAAYQAHSLAVCERYQTRLGIPLKRVRSGDEDGFTRAVNAITASQSSPGRDLQTDH